MFYFLSFATFRKYLAKYIFRGEKAEVAYQYLGSLCDANFVADNFGNVRVEEPNILIW